ncbi:DNA cytosine methyltransferase [Rhizobium leguminosarum]|uniref:DNA cytosine methyltransferase n=1 Tax=Rhizobium leguminosarum TaxID=384 RepID=UPI003F965BFB
MAEELQTDGSSPRSGALQASHKAALHQAGERIQKFKKKQIEYFLKVAEEAAALKSALGPGHEESVTSWLRQEMSFSADEAEVIANCPKDVTASARLLEGSDVSVATVRAIIGSDEDARSESLIRIARGDRVDEEVIEKIRRVKYLEASSAEELERQRRSEALKSASSRLGAATISKLEHEASKLLALVDGTINYPASGGLEKELDSNEYRRAVREHALSLLQTVESLFGLDHPPRHRTWEIDKQGTAAASISYSWYVLRDLADGALGSERLSKSESDWKGIRKCLEFLAGDRFSAISHSSTAGDPFPPRIAEKLSFVDIDAGVGGTSLGLQAAGFHAAAVWVKDADARKAVRLNRPSWGTRKFVPEDFKAELRQLAEVRVIDLVTCGLPWHHYHYSQESPAAARNAVDSVSILNPKVFVFEVASESYDANVAGPFKDLGYDVRWHTVDISQFGVVQAKSRSVMVGARDGCLDNLSMPVVNPPLRKKLSDTIGDLVAGHVWQDDGDEDMRLRHYEKLDNWMTLCSREFPLAPEMPQPHGRRRVKDWKERGIDIKGYTNRPPTPADLHSEQGFRLSNAMLKRIQGFPDRWIVNDKKSNAPQIAGAFPPVAAKMLGLAIHSALTGAEFDYRLASRNALLTPRWVAIRKGDPLELRSVPASWLLSDPNSAFRKSSHTQRLAQRYERLRKEQPASASVATGDPVLPEEPAIG